jgi:DNA (cytosine-5)-methyltransferase 1
MNMLSLFSGIGGFDLAAQIAGIKAENHFFSEVDKYAIGNFTKHFPAAIALGDARKINYALLPRGDWIITGSPPCQPFSNAGKKKGKEDDRNLFPETIRAMEGLRPCFAIFENVFEVLDYVDGEILPAIEDIGYKTETICLCARAVGANHNRKRLWIIAYPDRFDVETWVGIFKESEKKIFRKSNQSRYDPKRWMESVYSVAGGDDGLSKRVGIKSLGNAIVPQIPELFFMLPFFDKWREAPAPAGGGVNDNHAGGLYGAHGQI